MTNRHERRKQMATGRNMTGEFNDLMNTPHMMQMIIASLIRQLGGSVVLTAEELVETCLVLSSVDKQGKIHMVLESGASISQAGNA